MKYIDIGNLWRMSEMLLKRNITQNEVKEKSGVTQATISKMKRGGECDVVKLAKVMEALYDISGLPRPEIIMVAWLE
jgi:predicted transcriptional regulator